MNANSRELEGTALISGLIISGQADQFAFDLVHGQGKFDKIIAFTPDSKSAKKKLLGRSARYSGLSSLLEFTEGSTDDLLATDGPLTGVNSWLAFEVDSASVLAKAEAAKAAAVKNVIFVVSGDADMSAAEALLKESGATYTFIRTGEVVDGDEDMMQVFLMANITANQEPKKIKRGNVVRVACEALQIPSATNVALELRPAGIEGKLYMNYFRKGGQTKNKKKWKMGRTRTEEIEDLMNKGETVFDEFDKSYKRWLKGEIKTREEEVSKDKVLNLTAYYNDSLTSEERQEQRYRKLCMDRCIGNFNKQNNNDIFGQVRNQEEYLFRHLEMTIEDMRDQVAFDEYDNIRFIRRSELEYERAQYLREMSVYDFTDERKAWLKIWDEGMLMQFGPTSNAAKEAEALKELDEIDFVKWKEEALANRSKLKKRPEPEKPKKTTPSWEVSNKRQDIPEGLIPWEG